MKYSKDDYNLTFATVKVKIYSKTSLSVSVIHVQLRFQLSLFVIIMTDL